MCGIVGIITAASNGYQQDELNAFRDLLVVDTIRGFDSTGAFGVSNKGNVGILKAAMTGGQFVTTKEYSEFTKDAYREGQFLVGHNRWATSGAVNDKNAHPFWVDDKIVLVQNGTYKGSHKHHKDTEVDTEAIAHVISENSDIEEALKKINAAYALVWFNTETKTLHMIRNDERPLYHADTKNGSVIFASEMEFILMAASRNKLALKDLPTLLDVHTLYSYQLDKTHIWQYDEKKLNCEYKWSVKDSFSVGTWRPARHKNIYPLGHPFRYELSDDEEEAETILKQQSAGSSVDSRQMTIQALGCVYEGDFNEFTVTHPQALALVEECMNFGNRKHMVELFDYKPGNTHNDCQVWHVYGRILEAEESTNPRVLYHKTFWNKTEEEIMAMTLKGIYTVSVRAPVENIVKAQDKEKNRVVSVLMYDEEIISVYEPTPGIQ